MESKTLQFLKNCSNLSEIEENSALKLHYRTLLIKHQSSTGSKLHTQNEHFKKGKQAKPAPVKNAEVECKFCFTKAIPEFKVKRHRPKGQKKLKKSLVFECKTCHKVILKKEHLPTLETLKNRSANKKPVEENVNYVKEETIKEVVRSEKPKKKKRKKDHNAGLIIPVSLQKKSTTFGGSDKLKNLLSNESNESGKQSRLQMMLK